MTIKNLILTIITFLIIGCGGSPSSTDTQDTTKPVITLNGSNPVNLTVGYNYTEAGATATDDIDGAVTVTHTGSVDTSTAATYTISYSASDAAGNTAIATRTVIIANPPKVYGELGAFKDSVKFYNDKVATDKYTVYFPEGHLTNAPIVLFLPGGSTPLSYYNGVMAFIASHGYFVIGTTVNGEYSDYSTNIAFTKALVLAKSTHPEMDFSKFAVMGHSQGGGLAFPVMEHFLDTGDYGTDKNLVISLDGWFAFGMNQQDLRELNTMAAFIQFGGYAGTGTDPRIHLTISNLIDDANEKTFLTLNENTRHMYIKGDLNLILPKKDLLKPVIALLDYKLKGDNDAKKIVFKDYADTLQKVNAQLPIIKAVGRNSCNGDNYNAKNTTSQNDINYCTPEAY